MRDALMVLAGVLLTMLFGLAYALAGYFLDGQHGPGA